MERFKDSWVKLSWTGQFFWIVIIHLLINAITFFIFFLDDFSVANQLVHSVIHLCFFVLLIQLIYKPKRSALLNKKKEKWWISGFIILNVIPFGQGYEGVDNGFVPMWAMASQVNFGFPAPYFRWFTTAIHNNQGNRINSLLHLNLLFSNLYCWGVFTILVLTITKKIFKRNDTTTNTNHKI